MPAVDVQEFVENELGLAFIRSSSKGDSNELQFESPFDGDKFYINDLTEKWKCFKSDEGGRSLRSLVNRMEHYGVLDEPEIEAARGKLGNDKERKDRMRALNMTRSMTAGAQVATTPVTKKIWKATVEFCHERLNAKGRARLGERVSDTVIDYFQIGVSSKKLPEYLVSELGYDPELCIKAGVLREYDSEAVAMWEGATILPNWADGEVVSIEYRLRDQELIEKYSKYMALKGYERHLLNADTLTGNDTVYLSEGFFDTVSLVERGFPAVGIPGNSSFKTEWAEKFRAAGVGMVYVVLDNGEKNVAEKRQRIGDRLRAVGVEAIDIHLPSQTKDINDYFTIDGGTIAHFQEITDKHRAAYEANAYPMSLDAFWPTFEQELRSRIGRELLGFKSGFVQLDNKLSGIRGVIALAGMPGVGKSSWALQTAWSVAALNGAPVVYVSMEMFRQQIMEKVVSRLTRAPYKVVAMGEVFANGDRTSDFKITQDAIAEKGKLFYVMDRSDRPKTRMNDVIDYVGRLKRLYKSERAFVVFDSLQNLARYNRDDDGRLATKDLLDEMMMRVYEAAHNNAFDALLISHVPKAAKGKVDQFIFSGSGGIDFESDVTMLLHEPKRETEIGDDGEEEVVPLAGQKPPGFKQVTLSILKSRFSRTGNVKFLFHPETSRFEEQ